MTMYAQEKDTPSPEAVRRVLARMLSKKLVDAVLVPARTAYSVIPMPTLIADPQRMEAADPLAPVAPFNAARQAAAVARHPTRKRVALVLRPCEIRAFVELVKLRQCTLENCVLIGIECLGRLEKEAYARQASTDPDFTQAFYTNDDLRGQIITTCKTCDHFQPEGADLTVSVLGPRGCSKNGLRRRISSFERPRRLLTALKNLRASSPTASTATTAVSPARSVTARSVYL
jgi:formate dehydrogenase subunit beta